VKWKHLESGQTFSGKSQMISQVESKQKGIPFINSAPTTHIIQEKFLSPLNSSFIKNKTEPNLFQNKRKIIQQTIILAEHLPILDSAKTGHSSH
jgi:hypothetical protein